MGETGHDLGPTSAFASSLFRLDICGLDGTAADYDNRHVPHVLTLRAKYAVDHKRSATCMLEEAEHPPGLLQECSAKDFKRARRAPTVTSA
jgi:hypothetical protein